MATTLPVFDMTTSAGRAGFEERFALLRASSSMSDDYARIAADLIEQTRQDGDDAIVAHMRQFTDPQFARERIVVTDDELTAAERSLDARLRGALERAIEHVREYQQHILPPASVDPVHIGGAELGLRWTPIEPVGLLVPGGSAVLFSTLIMLAVPALVAGVHPEQIAVASPPPYRKEGEPAGDISAITLAVAKMLGIGRVYRIGGPPAVAALAYGTASVQPVNFIAGPGHPVVQTAKLRVSGVVGVDGFYGASEIVTVADDSADPQRIASDLIAQAEHNPGKCFLLAWDRGVIERIEEAVALQLPRRQRREPIERSLRSESFALLVAGEDEACAMVDRLAAEHVNLAVRDPQGMLAKVRHGGEFFLGDATPVAAGDYYAGPSHTLPTGTTARFTSGVSVYTFLKRSGTVAYPQGMPQQAIEDVALLAEAEGLDAHAASVRTRQG